MATEKSVAIVTGGAQGLGNAITRELLDNGYKVCMTDINTEKGEAVTQELKNKHGDSNIIFRMCDVTQKSHLIDVFEYVLKEFKRIDLLVNNAGILDEKNPLKMIHINLMGPIYGCEIALQYMGKDNGGNGGMVLNVASIVGLCALECVPAYTASKHGVVGLTRSYGTDYYYTRSGIIFTALCPYFINTELLQNITKTSLKPGLDVTRRDDLMDPSYVAKAAMKLVQDKKNGSTLGVTEEKWFGYKYIGFGEYFEIAP